MISDSDLACEIELASGATREALEELRSIRASRRNRDKPLIDRFMDKVQKDSETGCWLWRGSNGKQGVVWIGGSRRRRALASRVAYEIFNGPIQGDLKVLHRCDEPSCVNPEHLFLGSVQDNSRDMQRKGRGVKSLRGLPYGVNLSGSTYQARVVFAGKLHYLGRYRTVEEAHSVATAKRDEFLALVNSE